NGKIVDERIVERLMLARRVSLRTGCFCNPGVAEYTWDLNPEKYKYFKPKGWASVRAALGYRPPPPPTADEYITGLGLKSAGAVRVSLGVASSLSDVIRFVQIVREEFLNRQLDDTGLRPRLGC